VSWGEYLHTFRKDRSVIISRVTQSKEMVLELFAIDHVTMQKRAYLQENSIFVLYSAITQTHRH